MEVNVQRYKLEKQNAYNQRANMRNRLSLQKNVDKGKALKKYINVILFTIIYNEGPSETFFAIFLGVEGTWKINDKVGSE